MLVFYGYAMVATFMALIMTKRMSALVGLIVVPIVFALLTGHQSDLGTMMLDGIRKLAPTGIMLMFGILYFSIMTDAGLFDPIVHRVVRMTKGDPLRLLVGTAVMGTIVALDGDGATTYVICAAALLPIYRKLGVKLQYMATILLMSIGIMNIVPWGGPTARAPSAMHLEVAEVFLPLIPPMLVGFGYQVFVAAIFGMRERVRIGVMRDPAQLEGIERALDDMPEHRRPKMMWANLALTVALLYGLVSDLLPLAVLFMVATALALMLNYPQLKQQQERVASHAANVLAVVSLIFAAGIFTGVIGGTGMLKAMSESLLFVMPDWLGPYLAPATALISAPATYVLTNDAFYFGVLPLLASTADAYGIGAAEMARASLIGQPIHLLSPLVASTYLLVSLLDLNYADNQRASIAWVFGLVLAMLAAALLFGIIPLRG
jgi:CitMHS family citrate-Mg2+:H+ or citrate-Ca2+:H+ symporter